MVHVTLGIPHQADADSCPLRTSGRTKHPEPRSADSGRRRQQVHLCRPRSERTPKPQWADLGRRRPPSIQSPEVLTPVGEGSKSTCADLGRRGHLSLNGLTSVGEGTQASRAPKCRLRSERAASPLVPTLVGEDIQASTGRPRSEKASKHLEPQVLTSVEEGSKSTCADLGRRGHPSLNGSTSVGEGIQASRAPKYRL